MNLLVTGSSGYFGSEIVKELSGTKNTSIFLVVEEYLPHFPQYTQFIGDLNDERAYSKFKNIIFDLIIHCAGYVPKKTQEDVWAKCLKGNVLATESLIKHTRCKKFIYISTCEVYGFQEKQRINEDEVPLPSSNYARSKWLAEKKCVEFCRKKNVKLCILRFTTLFGPGDKIRRAIPNFINSALSGQKIEIVGDGQNTRDYLFIKDAARAAVLAALNFRSGIYNVSSGKGIKIIFLAKKILEILNADSKIIFKKRAKNILIPHSLVLDNSKFVSNFNFKPKYSLRDGILLTAKPLRSLLFDLDGTLLDISDRWYALHGDLSRRYRFAPLPKGKYIVIKRRGIREQDIIMKTNMPSSKIADYIKQWNRRVETKRYLVKDRLKRGAISLLKKLSEKFTLILITKRKHQKNCFEELGRFGLRKYFSDVRFIGSLSSKRAFADFLHRAFIQNAGLVGDTGDDYAFARNLDIKCILVGAGARTKKYLLGLRPMPPSRVVSDLDQITVNSLLR